jgi:hypothetical protein
LRTGEVVILVPFLKFGELLTTPVIDPSSFCAHRLITGMLSLGAALGAGFLGATLVAGLAAGFLLPPPNIDKVGRGAAAGAAAGVGAGFGDPKIDKVGRIAVFFTTGARTGVGFKGLGGEKIDRVGLAGDFFGGGVGTDFGAGFRAEKIDRVGRTAAFFGAGAAGLGAGAVFGVPKKEKD